MKSAVVLLLSVAAFSCAQDKRVENRQPTGEKKRLESVTWDLTSHKLIWTVQRGSERDGQFVASRTDRYEITPDDAVMAFANERRGFTKEEAASLHKLLDTLSLYCAESVVWWDQGQGNRLDGVPSNGPAKPEAAPERHRVDEHREVPRAPAHGEKPKVLVARSER